MAYPGAYAGQPLLTAWQFLADLEPQRHPDMHGAPLELVPGAWRRLVLPRRQAVADRRAYTLCVLERLQDSLRHRDVFVRRSARWGDPRVKLFHGPQWEALRPPVCRALSRSEAPAPELQALAQQLDTTEHRTAANLPTNAAVRVEAVDGRDTLTLTGLDKLDAPAS